MSKRENFYRRDPMAALNGMIGLTLEEKGVYNVVIDLLYSTWRPVEDNRQFIANWCGCAVQKVNPIIERLIAKGKIRRVQEGGVWVLTNDHFDDERHTVKGLGSGRRKAAEEASGRGEVEEKSAGVREKSAGVSENLPLLEGQTLEKQRVTPLEKTREDKNTPKPPKGAARVEPSGFAEWWAAYPRKVAKRAAEKAYRAALKRGTDPPALLRDVRTRSWPAEERFIPNPATYLNGDRWLDGCGGGALFDRTATWTDAEWRTALRLRRESGDWSDVLGPPPGSPGCRVPPHLLVQATAGAAA